MVAPSRGTFVSLYSGAGGLDLGFIRAGFTPIWANDIDPFAAQTYRANVGDHIAVGDVRAQRLPPAGSAELVIGGPPCQGFSVAGRMDPDDPRSRHVWDFLGVVGRVSPRVFVMENVAALAENERWADLRDDLVAAAKKLGFVTSLFVLNAADYGVPQARRRMFLVGVREGNELAPPPAVSARKRKTLRDVLSQLPTYGQAGNSTLCVAKITPAVTPVLRRSPFAGMLFNGQGRPLDLNRPASTLPASMGGNRTPIIDQHQLEHGGPSWVIEYHRRLWNGGKPYKSIPPRLRRITVEEAAAIQTFPRSVKFAGPVSAQFRQIGNAVPPRLAYHVAAAVRRAADGAARRQPTTSEQLELVSA